MPQAILDLLMFTDRTGPLGRVKKVTVYDDSTAVIVLASALDTQRWLDQFKIWVSGCPGGGADYRYQNYQVVQAGVAILFQDHHIAQCDRWNNVTEYLAAMRVSLDYFLRDFLKL